MSISPMQLGVIGAGNWGANLIRNCAQLGVLYVVCDTSPTALDGIEVDYPGVVTTTDVDSLLQEPIHGVIIAAPAHLHAMLGRRAIAAGKHIFVEKPFALSVADAEAVAGAAGQAGLECFAGHVLLFHPAIRRLLELVRGGAIGRIVHVRSRRTGLGRLREHESVWWSYAPHDVALVLALLGTPPTLVSGVQHRASGHPLADFAYADFEFSAGASAHVEVTWLDPERSSRLDVFGGDGVLSFKDTPAGGTLTLTRYEVTTSQRGGRSIDSGPVENIPFQMAEPLRCELEAFLEAVATGAATPCDARAAVEVVRVLSSLDARAPVFREMAVAL
ncbi:Gfo/Idh/MocA family oxidoreductase [bacterium]|nr:MAG: Gfo/Idh/MocA family oxidoreductase [bacterium]